jgi:hypothetical protein
VSFKGVREGVLRGYWDMGVGKKKEAGENFVMRNFMIFAVTKCH